MKAKSKIVTSNQEGIHKDLSEILANLSSDVYQRPISSFSNDCYKDILKWIDSQDKNLDIILDMGCGVGESSFHLAEESLSKALVIGIDKSEDRLLRKSLFKKVLPSNLLLIRGELLDLWYLFATKDDFPRERVKIQYILYPNPWPKASHVKRRWHANSIAPFIFKVCSKIELRTNWKIYAEEFLSASNYFGYLGQVASFVPTSPMTPFERKYLDSGHDLYEVLLHKKGAY